MTGLHTPDLFAGKGKEDAGGKIGHGSIFQKMRHV